MIWYRKLIIIFVVNSNELQFWDNKFLIIMKKFFPFKITHIDLSKEKSFISPATNNIGNYIVLWWKEIALGDFYIESNEQQFSEKEYRNKIAATILPVIDSYSRKINLNIDWENFLLGSKIQDWAVKMEQIFSIKYVKEMPKNVPVSVVICTNNRPSYLYKCLSDLKELKCLPQEIIVVDNAPIDDKTKEVTSQFPGVIYVVESRKGLSNARNTGILNTTCPIVAFTDDDVLVHPLWVFRVWETFQTDSIQAMTGLVIVESLKTEARFLFEKHWSFNMGYLEKSFDKNFLHSSKAPPVWKIGAGANMAFRRTIFEEVGFFHELLGAGTSGCSEDSEIWFRILAKGKVIQYNPKAIVYHTHRKTIKELKNQIFSYMRGFTVAALWQQKQMPKFSYKYLLFFYLPYYFSTLLVKGFPGYNARYKTIWVEIKGFISGLKFFYNEKNRPFFQVKKKPFQS